MPNETTKAPDPGFINIPLSKLHDLPDVSVPKYASKTLGGLVTGIMAKGVQEPISVRKREDGEYELIDGYRRRQAAEQAGLKNIPGKVAAESPEQARSMFYKLHGLPEPKKQTPAPGKDATPEVSADAEKKPAQDEAKKPDEAKDTDTKRTRIIIDPAAPKKEIPIEKPATDKRPEVPDAKVAAPATDKTGDKKEAPPTDKATAPKQEDKAAAPKPDDKAATKPEEKKPEAAKPEQTAKPAEKKTAAPAEKPKPAAAAADKDKVAAKPGVYAEGPTGTTITKVLGSKLNPPDEKARASLPLPGEGEAFAVTLHPAYLEKAEFNHFSVDRDSDDFKELFKSIEMNGVKDPVLARPGKDGTLEIISGQRRHLIASELNYPVPTIIQRMDDDDARILVADGNLHREKIGTYDQSRALRMKMDSMKHKAGRRKKGQIASGKTDEVIAAEMGISTAKLHRLMRLSDANREICGMIDDGKLTLSVASAISQLKPANQTKLAELIDINLKPSAEQVERMRKAEASGKLTEKAMRDIIDNKDIAPKAKPAPVTPPPAPASPPTPAPSNPTPSMAPAPSSIPTSPDVAAPAASTSNVVPLSTVTAHNSAEGSAPAKPAEADPFVGKQERPENTRVILSGDRLRKYFPDVNMTPREIEDKVYLALDFYQKHQEREKQKAAIFDKGKGGSAR